MQWPRESSADTARRRSRRECSRRILGNALEAALCNGHEKVVQIQLDAGADKKFYNNALQAAIYAGYGKVVQILRDRGANAALDKQNLTPP
jgi:ankyrin repeat protein